MIHRILWVVHFSGQGVINEENITYLHKNGNKIDGGVSGYSFGMFEYSKESCDISIVKDKLNRTCISETLFPEDGITTYKEEKKVEYYSINEEGFKLKRTVVSQRSNKAAVDDPSDLMTSVEKMDWMIISN